MDTNNVKQPKTEKGGTSTNLVTALDHSGACLVNSTPTIGLMNKKSWSPYHN